MKNVKTYEEFDEPIFYDVKVGDYVIVIKAYRSNDGSVKIQNGERCKVVSLDGMSEYYVIIENQDGVREEYRRNRIIPELLYQQQKYNL